MASASEGVIRCVAFLCNIPRNRSHEISGELEEEEEEEEEAKDADLNVWKPA